MTLQIMANGNPAPITLSGVRLTFLNFEGAVKKPIVDQQGNLQGMKGRYNTNGARKFALRLDEDMARLMESDGFNIKWPKPDPERYPDPAEDPRQATLEITVSKDQQVSPSVGIMIHNNQTGMDDRIPEEALFTIDDMNIAYADVVINPYAWTMNEGTPDEKHGIKAYLRAIKIYLNDYNYSFEPNYGVELED
ncbi:single strand annealing protein [Lactococcus phage P118]|uniref:Putative phage ssDNA-binding domain-containing protein n=1 Tax=Lactococcus phage P118 TaxID=1476888 RepID=X4YUW1_9CAUD|nr:single strand annealing protein [Lactococcus phage P118]AHV83188.1 hypothetical protein P118_0071 [Lactococcus phage P118]